MVKMFDCGYNPTDDIREACVIVVNEDVNVEEFVEHLYNELHNSWDDSVYNLVTAIIDNKHGLYVWDGHGYYMYYDIDFLNFIKGC